MELCVGRDIVPYIYKGKCNSLAIPHMESFEVMLSYRTFLIDEHSYVLPQYGMPLITHTSLIFSSTTEASSPQPLIVVLRYLSSGISAQFEAVSSTHHQPLRVD